MQSPVVEFAKVDPRDVQVIDESLEVTRIEVPPVVVLEFDAINTVRIGSIMNAAVTLRA